MDMVTIVLGVMISVHGQARVEGLVLDLAHLQALQRGKSQGCEELLASFILEPAFTQSDFR